MSKHLISIVIPTFNSETTILKTLASILEQTFQDYEVIIVDGVSTDRTLELAKTFNDSRIRIFSEKDSGIYDAMNKGIKLARGQWLYFLGGDDHLYKSTVLAEIAEFMTNNPLQEVIYGDVFSTRFNGLYDGAFDARKILQKNICHQAIFFQKSLFSKTGLFELKYKALADWHHNMKWVLSPKVKKLYTPIIIANYADGGYSSKYGDGIFNDDKILHYLRHVKKGITQKEKMSLYWFEAISAFRSKNISKLKKLFVLFFQIVFGV